MLDLAFVRSNLELVEAKLRDRGQDPAELLGIFARWTRTGANESRKRNSSRRSATNSAKKWPG